MVHLGAERKLLTVKEVALTMRVSTMTVYRLIKNEELRAIRVGRHFRVLEHDLNSYLDSQVVSNNRPAAGGGPWPAA